MHKLRAVAFLFAISCGCDSPGGGSGAAPTLPSIDDTTAPTGSGDAASPADVTPDPDTPADVTTSTSTPTSPDAHSGDGSIAHADVDEPPPDTDGPRILDLATDVSRLNANQVVIVSAIVTDPDGIDDLIGGTLKDEHGGTYGSFATAAAEGAYTMTVSWASLNQMAPIDFVDEGRRKLIAEFFDQAGHHTSGSIELTLDCVVGPACDGACYYERCDGECLSILSDNLNCGSCGHECLEGGHCDGGECYCYGMVCGDRCVPENDHANCGACDNACRSDESCDGWPPQCACGWQGCDDDATCVDRRCVPGAELRIDPEWAELPFRGGLEVRFDGPWTPICTTTDWWIPTWGCRDLGYNDGSITSGSGSGACFAYDCPSDAHGLWDCTVTSDSGDWLYVYCE